MGFIGTFGAMNSMRSASRMRQRRMMGYGGYGGGYSSPEPEPEPEKEPEKKPEPEPKKMFDSLDLVLAGFFVAIVVVILFSL